MKHIPIVVISDKNLAFAVATTFINLLETKRKETFYDLYVVISPDFGVENEKKIKSIEASYSGCTIHFIHGDNRFSDIKNQTNYISNACAYKFCLAEFLPQYDKVLYLDTDIIVFDDLTSLYQIDIKDNYIGGIFSLNHFLDKDLYQLLKIPDLLHYVNAGVLLFNLKQIRNDKIIPQCLKLIGAYKGSVDQHIYNKVCYGHIALIPPKYNVTYTNDSLYQTDRAKMAFTHQELQDVQNPVIYHYAGPLKPWNSIGMRYCLLWLRYHMKSPYRDIHLDLTDPQHVFFTSQDTKIKYSFWERIFSIKNQYKNGKKRKVITILGIHWFLPIKHNSKNGDRRDLK